jgi:hypothetical protein
LYCSTNYSLWRCCNAELGVWAPVVAPFSHQQFSMRELHPCCLTMPHCRIAITLCIMISVSTQYHAGPPWRGLPTDDNSPHINRVEPKPMRH